MDKAVLCLTHDNKKSFTYSKLDLIEESAHLKCMIESMFKFSECGGSNEEYNKNLIEYAENCLNQWIDDGYEVTVS